MTIKPHELARIRTIAGDDVKIVDSLLRGESSSTVATATGIPRKKIRTIFERVAVKTTHVVERSQRRVA